MKPISVSCHHANVDWCSNISEVRIISIFEAFILAFEQQLTSVYQFTRAVWKVRGLALLLRVGTSWRCGDGLFFKVPLGKRCTSYNAPPTSRKRAADRWSLRNFLPRNSLFVVGKAQKSHGVRSWLYGGCSNGVPPISMSVSIATFQSRNADAPLSWLRNPKRVLLKRP
jgi:hypothetical protein